MYFMIFIIRLNQNHKTIINLNTNLQSIVAERTAELEEKNKKLSLQKESLKKNRIELLKSKKKQKKIFSKFSKAFLKTKSGLIEMIESKNLNKCILRSKLYIWHWENREIF